MLKKIERDDKKLRKVVGGASMQGMKQQAAAQAAAAVSVASGSGKSSVPRGLR